MLKLKNLSFYYNNDLHYFFDDLNIDLNIGNVLLVSGKSGSGKTTLLKIIGSLVQPINGDVFWNERSIFNSKNNFLYYFRNKISGFAFQDFKLIEEFSVRENILLPLYIGKISKDKDWFDYLTNYFEINDILDKNIEYISGGEKERVSLVKSMIHKPQVLFLDEPGTFLNEYLRDKTYSLIKEYSRDNICILASHDQSFKNFVSANKLFNNKYLNFFM